MERMFISQKSNKEELPLKNEGIKLLVKTAKEQIKSLAEDQLEFIINLPYDIKMILKMALLEFRKIKDTVNDHLLVWEAYCQKFCKNNSSLKTYVELLKSILFDLQTRLFKPQVLENLPAFL